TEEREDLSGADLEVDAANRLGVPVGLAQAPDRDDWIRQEPVSLGASSTVPLDWRSCDLYCTSVMAQSKTAKPNPANPFAVDHQSELPVGVQIGWRLRALVAGGRLAPGDSLPSVRRLAEWADVNVNTVR